MENANEEASNIISKEEILEYVKLKSSSPTKMLCEKQYITEVIEYFEKHNLNKYHIVYWDRSRFDKDGNLYLNGDRINEDVYKQLMSIYIINQTIQKVFQIEVEDLGYQYNPYLNENENTFSLVFFNGIANDNNEYGSYRKPSRGEKPRIEIYERSIYRKLQSKDSNERVGGCRDIFKLLFHELQHHRQFMMTQLKVSSKDSLMYAKEDCLREILEEKFYSSEDDGNYCEITRENNAFYIGALTYKNIMEDNDSDLLDEIEFHRAYSSEAKYLINFDTKDGKNHFKYDGVQEKNDVATEILDKTITKELLIEKPILQKEYNLDGTRKSAEELVTQLDYEINSINSIEELDEETKKSLIKDTQEMYYEIIYIQLKHKSEDINQMGNQYIDTLLDEMIEYFKKEYERRIINQRILCQERYLYEDENPNDEYKKSVDYLRKYYNEKCQFLQRLRMKENEFTTYEEAKEDLTQKLGRETIDIQKDVETIDMVESKISKHIREQFEEEKTNQKKDNFRNK